MSKVTTMVLMFYEATAFNQDLCAWKDDILTGTTTTSMFSYSGCTDDSDPTSTNVCQSCPTPSPTLSPTTSPTLSPTQSPTMVRDLPSHLYDMYYISLHSPLFSVVHSH